MPSTTDGIVLIAQIHGIGASSTDNLIQLVNSSSGIEVAAIGAQIVAMHMRMEFGRQERP